MKILLILLLLFIYYFPNQEMQAIIVNVLSYIWIFSIPFFLVYINNKKGKEYEVKLNDNINVPINRTPVELGYLLTGRINRYHLSATFMSLIAKGVLEVKRDKNNYIFIYNKGHEQDLSQSESFLIHWFINRIGDKEYVSLETIVSESKSNSRYFYKSYKEWTDTATFEALKQNYFEGKRVLIDDGSSYLAIAIILAVINFLKVKNYLLIIGMLVIISILLLYVFNLKRRTKEGNLEYQKWRLFEKNIELINNKISTYHLNQYALYFKIFGKLGIYKETIIDKYKDNPTVNLNSQLLKLIENGDMIIINKRIEATIWNAIIRMAIS
ncbi:MAG: DUF2207 domain-containing protein [Bacilli bacterium]|nr:DUF2207 domain-containing protein [Bacilli bacterium]